MVNTKLIMTFSSLLLGLAGVFALFLPDLLISAQGVTDAGTISILVQLMGALYFSFALMNWTARGSAIGGVYARPVSLANFAHFFAGALLLLTNTFDPIVFAALVVYTVCAICFYWLVFRATGIKPSA